MKLRIGNKLGGLQSRAVGLIGNKPTHIKMLVGYRRLATGRLFDRWATGIRQGLVNNFIGLAGFGASGLRQQKRFGMPPHLTPMFDHTKARATQQNHKGQPAANQTGMNRRFHRGNFTGQTYGLS